MAYLCVGVAIYLLVGAFKAVAHLGGGQCGRKGPLAPGDCLLQSGVCDGTTCVLGQVLKDVNDNLVDHLSHTTLAQAGEIFEGKRFLVA